MSKNNNCGCSLIFWLFVLYLACYTMYYQDKNSGMSTDTPRKHVDKKRCYHDSSDDVPDTSFYYPERAIDSLAHKPLATGEHTKAWHIGYERGSSKGKKDRELSQPYASYSWIDYGDDQVAADFKLGFWIGYHRYNPTIPLLSDDEVRACVAPKEEEKHINHLYRERAPEEPRRREAGSGSRDAYDEGYYDGYEDGYSEADDGYPFRRTPKKEEEPKEETHSESLLEIYLNGLPVKH